MFRESEETDQTLALYHDAIGTFIVPKNLPNKSNTAATRRKQSVLPSAQMELYALTLLSGSGSRTLEWCLRLDPSNYVE